MGITNNARPPAPRSGNSLRLFPENYPDFHSQGAPPCTEVDPDLFFPLDRDDPLNTPSMHNPNNTLAIYPMSPRSVKQVCDACPYEDACLQWALDHGEPGIWGGTTDHDRRQIKRKKHHARY